MKPRVYQTDFGLFRHGERRADGHYFNGISRGYELWISPKTWRKRHSTRYMRWKHKQLMRRLRNPKYRARFDAQRRRQKIVNPARFLWSAAKIRARREGLAFTIKHADIVVPKYCPVLGMRLRPHRGGVPASNSPSLDRINPGRGYVKGNVIVVSWLANRIKSDATPAQVLAVGKFYQRLERRKCPK